VITNYSVDWLLSTFVTDIKVYDGSSIRNTPQQITKITKNFNLLSFKDAINTQKWHQGTVATGIVF